MPTFESIILKKSNIKDIFNKILQNESDFVVIQMVPH
jgi:hypothetical protein